MNKIICKRNVLILQKMTNKVEGNEIFNLSKNLSKNQTLQMLIQNCLISI